MFEIIPGGTVTHHEIDVRSALTILCTTVEISRPVVFLDECLDLGDYRPGYWVWKEETSEQSKAIYIRKIIIRAQRRERYSI
jgi:hypothetical protein